MAETHFIEVVTGRGTPPSLELRPGVELAPLSVGTGGAWQVSAPGVRLVHLYVYFDGQTLFLQSAEADDPPMMNGRPIPSAWTPVPGRCNITFGQAQLQFRPAEGDAPESDDERTVAAPLEAFPPPQNRQALRTAPLPATPAPAPIPARPFKPGAFAAPIDESTRLQPLEDFLNGPADGDATRVEPLGAALDAMPPQGGVPNIRPAAGAPWSRDAPPMQNPQMQNPQMRGMQPQMGMPPQQMGMPPGMGGMPPQQGMGPPPGMGGMPPMQPGQQQGPPSGLLNIGPPSLRKPEAPETFGAKMSREWKAAPAFRKALIIAMPFGLVLAFWFIFAGLGGGAATAAANAAAASASANAASAASAAAAASSAPATTAGGTAPTPPPPGPTNPPGPTDTTTPPPPNNPPTPRGGGSATPVGDAGPVDRRERQAADLVSTHNYDQAIRIYEQLAAERPQNPAFHEAARILREKAESGKP